MISGSLPSAWCAARRRRPWQLGGGERQGGGHLGDHRHGAWRPRASKAAITAGRRGGAAVGGQQAQELAWSGVQLRPWRRSAARPLPLSSALKPGRPAAGAGPLSALQGLQPLEVAPRPSPGPRPRSPVRTGPAHSARPRPRFLNRQPRYGQPSGCTSPPGLGPCGPAA